MREVRPCIRLTNANLQRLGVRQWGMPTGCYLGKAWRTKMEDGSWTMTVLLPHVDPAKLRTCTFGVRRVRAGVDQYLPDEVRAALAAYAKQWPASAPKFTGLGIIA